MADFYAKYPSTASGGSNASVGIWGNPAPSSATLIGGRDQNGDMLPVYVDNSGQVKVVIDSTVPTDTNIAKWGGTSTTLGQKAMAASVPVVIANDQSTLPVSAASLPLPSGAATETTLSAINTKTPALGQALAAASVPVVLTAAQLSTLTPLTTVAVTGPLTDTQLRATAVPVSISAGAAIIGKVSIDQTTPGTTNGVQVNAALPVGANVIGKVGIDQTTPGTTNLVALAANQSVNVAQINGITPLMGNGVTGTGSMRVTLASDTSSNTNPLLVNQSRSSSSAITSVASSASSVSLLASNSSRKGATFFNESTTILYLKLGATASTTSYTVQMPAGSYYELPFIQTYTGAIDGIWSSANGNVRITELT